MRDINAHVNLAEITAAAQVLTQYSKPTKRKFSQPRPKPAPKPFEKVLRSMTSARRNSEVHHIIKNAVPTWGEDRQVKLADLLQEEMVENEEDVRSLTDGMNIT